VHSLSGTEKEHAMNIMNITDPISVSFSVSTPYGQFNDAISHTPEEWAALTPEQFDAEKAARVANWVEIVSNPLPPVPATADDLIAQAARIRADFASLGQAVQQPEFADVPELNPLKFQLQTVGEALATADAILSGDQEQ
jgi:hypothetical protein